MLCHSFDREGLHDLFDRLPPNLRVRAARAVSEKLVQHATHHGCWIWAAWSAHELPTAYTLTLAHEFAGRMFGASARP